MTDIQLSPDQIKSFQQKILAWYKKNKRDLPWRHTRDPYKILVSEVMSQQTQIARVIPKYEVWIKALPTVVDLANASTIDVLRLWSGLGYNRRALYLKKCAEELIKNYSLQKTRITRQIRDSENQKIRRFHTTDLLSSPNILDIHWPQTEEELVKLSGIGEYTAKAILCFAFDRQIAVVDTNVRRIILTQFHFTPGRVFSNKELQTIAAQLLPHKKAYEWNQALMDYASAMLKNEKIPIAKQAPFKDSDRYYRGQIVKYLLQKKQTSIENLVVYFHEQQKSISKDRLSSIIHSLLKDSLIEGDGNKLSLK